MDYDVLESFISQPRLNRYLRSCDDSKDCAQKLYKINLKVSQAFYPILNLFETFFRNAICNAVSIEFDDPDWILNERNGFMLDARLRNVDSRKDLYMKKQVQNAEAKLRRDRSVVNANKLIAEQTFGFWTSFFDSKHYFATKGCGLLAFATKPSTINRKAIERKLTRVRNIRNRIYHNEPICFAGNNIDFLDARVALADIYDLLNWMNADLKIYIEEFDNVLDVMALIDDL